MQAINLQRNITHGFPRNSSTFGHFYFFSGPVPQSLEQVPYNLDFAQELIENCEFAFRGLISLSNEAPSQSVDFSVHHVQTSTRSGSHYINPSYPNEYQQSNIAWNIVSTTLLYGWGMALDSRLGHDSLSFLNTGFSNPGLWMYYTRSVAVSTIRIRQRQVFVDGAGTTADRFSFSTRIEVFYLDPDTGQLVSQGQYDMPVRNGLNTITLTETIRTPVLYVRSVAGTGFTVQISSSGQRSNPAFARWDVSFCAGFCDIDEEIAPFDQAPTWGIGAIADTAQVPRTQQGRGIDQQSFAPVPNLTNIPEVPYFLFDVGSTGSNSTCEFVNYPIPPNSRIDVSKFRLTFRS